MTLETELHYWRTSCFIGGVDEVGRGPLAGAVVAAAVMFERGFVIPPALKAVNDSKQVDALLRERLAEEIYKRALSVAVCETDVETIDRVNILQATFLAMRGAIECLSPPPEFLLIDGNRFLSPYPVPYQTVVKGDSTVFSIAAASIVAKVHRDRLMKALATTYPHYNLDRNMGYPTPDHIAAIRKHGRCPIHRLSFKLSALGEK